MAAKLNRLTLRTETLRRLTSSDLQNVGGASGFNTCRTPISNPCICAPTNVDPTACATNCVDCPNQTYTTCLTCAC